MLFFDCAMKYLESCRQELAETTVRTYYWNLKMFYDYFPELYVDNLTEEVISGYRTHLKHNGDKPATIAKAVSVIRIFTNKMYKDGLLEMNPFEKITIGRVYSKRGFLTTKELKKLYLAFLDRRWELTKLEQECLRAFLFSCFTGLRYGDLRSLTMNEIYDWKIRKQTHKTGEAVYIPIPVQARLLMPEDKKNPQDVVFHVVENSVFNRRLRSAAKKIGFPKYLHCHLARHTFATTCITLGIPLPATSKLLGHRDLNTTLIYAKYVDTFLDKEMKKFNKLQ